MKMNHEYGRSFVWLIASLLCCCSASVRGQGQTGTVDETAIGSIQDIPAIEGRIVEALKHTGGKGTFVIPEIRPVGTNGVCGKVCIAGRGRIPIAKDSGKEAGKGVVLEWIYPMHQGAELSMMKTKVGIITQHEDVDYSSAYSAGAVWLTTPELLKGEKIDPQCGVSIAPGVRLGSLYDGDGQMAFDYVQAGSELIAFPAGTVGSVHRFVGEITVGKYVFAGENDPFNPLTFLLMKDGYVYVRGKGTVTLPDGKTTQLGRDSTQLRLKTAQERAVASSPGVRQPGNSTPAPSYSPELIDDMAALKLMCAAVRLDRLGLLTVALTTEDRKHLADRLIALHGKYRIDTTTHLYSNARRWGCGQGSTGPFLYLEMNDWSEIFHVDSASLPFVKLSGGKLEINLQSLTISFEQGAVAAIGGKKYRYANNGWSAISVN